MGDLVDEYLSSKLFSITQITECIIDTEINERFRLDYCISDENFEAQTD